MHKTTFFKISLLTFIFLQGFVSYSQNLISYVSSPKQEMATDIFQIGKNTAFSEKQLNTKEQVLNKAFAPANINPAIKYAQLPYSGIIDTCGGTGVKLPKLFLCGGNDSRLIETGITDAQSIVWERFISGGSCATVSNSKCANTGAANTCWVQVATGPDFLANSAGQFRVKIVDKTATPYTHYFNVYQNTLIPTAVTKSDILRYNTCVINGKITVGGFGAGYEYSFTTTGVAGAWQDSNVFTTATTGNYTAFIRIKGVVGSCEFKVINLDIKSVNFVVTTNISSPKCFGGKGSVTVITNDVKQQYTYKIYSGATLISSSPITTDPDYTFTGLNPGTTYRIETAVVGTACMVDTRNVTIAAAPAELKANAAIQTALTPCAVGVIAVTGVTGGVSPYKYLVSLNGSPYVLNANNLITIDESGSYDIRVEDANGCFIIKNVIVNAVDKPSYTIVKTDGNCTGTKGTIKLNVSNPKGYIIEFNINGGTFAASTNTFSGLDGGNYIVIVRYKKIGVNSGKNCLDPAETIIIGASTALSASAGVAELSGCGPVGSEIQGKIRITNVQGGFPPYQYSFDNKATWITSNEAYINPITNLTVYVRDAVGCEYPMAGISLNPKPADPSIRVSTPVFNCDGTATTTVTITNDPTSAYTYNYYLDGNPNTPINSNVFNNVAQGDHTITVTYSVNTVPTYSNLLNEDFGSGDDTTSPGINTTYYCFERQVAATQCNGAPNINDGDYSVTSDIKFPFSTWLNPADHTTGTKVGKGRYLAVNIGARIPKTAILYQKQINDIIPFQPISVEIFALNLLRIGTSGADPDLQMALVDAGGNDISSIATAPIVKSNNWVRYLLTLNPGNNTSLTFVLRSNVQLTDGNDVAVDDIKVFQIPRTCNATAAFPITVDGSKAFSASITGYKDVKCNDETNGEITLSAKNFDAVKGFQYAVNGGAWQTVIPGGGATSGSITLPALASNTYNIQIRYDSSATSCTFPVAQQIKNPTPIQINASVTMAPTCTAGGTITAVATGGTPGYQYELRKSDGITPVVPFQASGVFNDVPVENYIVVVRDLNQCQTATSTVLNVVAPTPPKALIIQNTDLCFDNTSAKITVNINGGLAPFYYQVQFNSGSFSTPSATFTTPSFIYTATASGTYTFRVFDSNGCAITNEVTQIISPKLGATVTTGTTLSCDPTLPAATINVAIVGGTSPFTYSVKDKTSGTVLATNVAVTGTIFTYSATTAGTYEFEITDTYGCKTINDGIVSPTVSPTATATSQNPKCNDGTDGQVQIVPAGGSGGYTYRFNGSAFGSQSLYTSLNANTTTASTTAYTYQVKDSKGCVSPIYTVTLTNPTKVVATATIAPNTTCSTITVITASATGGSGTGYQYSFNGSPTYTSTNTFTVTNTAVAQTINYSVKDSNNCIGINSIVIPAYIPPTDLVFNNTIITCNTGSTTSTVTITTTGGSGALQFETIAPSIAIVPKQSSNIFVGLAAGLYTFRVTDSNGCTYTESHTIAPAAIIAVAGVKTDEKCVGAKDGTATFTITGASNPGNYNYVVTPATVTPAQITKLGNVVTVTGLSAGTYTLTVTDITTGCVSNIASVTVGGATPITYTVSGTKINCNSALSTLTFTGLTGGTPGYTYAYAKAGDPQPAVGAYGTTTTVDTAVLTSSIDVYVKDTNGCIEKKTITILAETSPTIFTPATICYTGTAIAVTITGTATGTPTYSKDGITFQNSPTFSLTPGSYTLTIKDGFGCTVSAPYIVAPQLTISTAVVPDTTCTPNTTFNLTAGGGTGAYTYEVSFNGGVYTAITSPFTATVPGTYRFRVTDSASPACSAVSTDVVVVTKPTVLTLSTTKLDVKCFGDTTGSITVTATSGKAPFEYSIDGGTNYVTTNVFSNLVAGNYNVLTRDALGCESVSTPVTIDQPTVLSATALAPPTTTCSTSTTVTVTAVGGTPGYTYSFNAGAFTATATFIVNDNGTDQTITFQVRDANGCTTASQNITVFKLNPPTDLTFSPLGSITCTATSTTITLGATGGRGTLLYETIAPSPIIVAKQTSNSFAGLTTGTYLFRVTDENGCVYTESYTVAPVTPINITGQKISDVLCNGGSTGIARYTVTGFSATGNYSVTITPAVPAANVATVGDVITLSNLASGTYNIAVVDNTTGCTANTNVVIIQPTNPLALAITGNINANCFIATAKVTMNASGGTSGYSYAFKPTGVPPVAADYLASNSRNLNPITSLTWDVWAKDANGCTTSTPVTIAQDAVPTVTASVSNQCSASGNNFTIVAVGAFGIAPYTYTINTAVAPTGPLLDTFTVAAGTYTITVKDANGCTNTTTITVSEALAATATLTKDLTCSLPAAATIAVTVIGGKAPFTYRTSFNGAAYSGAAIPFAGNTFTYAAAAPGMYQFEVTDANGCTKVTNTITINPIVNPVITGLTQTQTIKCNGDNTGAITVAIDATQGVGPFEYSRDGINFQASNVFTGLIAGTYTITVRDSKGCTNTLPATITIAQPAAITFDLTKVNITCNNPGGSSLGSITISNVLGGTAPFKYFITNNFGDVIAGNPFNAIAREDHTFTIINYGIYTINAIDANGCSFTKQITMASPPSDLDIDVTTLVSDCTTGGTAIVKAISAVGSGNYAFGILKTNISPYTTTWFAPDVVGGDTRTFTNLVPGVTYTFVVHDLTTHCYYVKAADQPIAPASTLTSTVTPNNITCKGANDGSVTFTISGFDSTTTSVNYQIFQAFSNVSIGGIISLPVTFGIPQTLTHPSPGTLLPGQYYIKFVEIGTGAFNGCQSASTIFEIKESAIALSVTASVIKNENCNALGIISAEANDGTAPYSFMISTSSTLPVATDPAWSATSTFNVAAGNYYVFVKDAYGCIQSSAVVPLIKDPEPVIALAVADDCALEGAFAINVNLTTPGIGPYTITVNGGAPQNVTVWPYPASNLSSGLQTIVVKDVNGCASTQTLTLYKKLSVNAELTKELDCTLSPTGLITLTVADGLFNNSDGLPDFAYELSTDNGGTYGVSVNFGNDTRSTTIPATSSITYQFRVTDLNGCSVVSTGVTVPVLVDPIATATFTNPSCPTDSDGTLTISATLGVAPYEYSIDGGTSWQTDDTFTGLSAGVVNYIVRDAKQCIVNGTETLVDPVFLAVTAVVTDFACNASNIPQPAIVTINVTAGTGTGPYKYNFDGSTTYLDANTFVVGNLAGQTVNYSVKDFNGCIFNGSVVVGAYQPLTDITFAGTAPTCAITTSDVTLTVLGGYTPMAKYEILSPTLVDNGTSNVFLTLAPDTYLFKVTDANGCSIQRSYTVDPVTPIAITAAIVNIISCNPLNGNNANGSATFTVTGFSATGNYSVTINPPVAPANVTNVGDVITLTNLVAGTYTVTVTDNTTGCSKFDSVTITEPAAITFTTSATKVFCSQDVSQITVNGVTGGTGVYSYAIVPTAAAAPGPGAYGPNPVLYVDTDLNLANLSWDVYVKDANGCVAMNTAVVVLDAAPTITSPAQDCYIGNPITTDLDLVGTSYNGIRTYTINGSAIAGNIAIFNGPGTYVLGVKDDNNCEAFVNYVIEKQLVATATLTKDLYCAAPIDATIKVDITDGVAPYTYQMYLNGTPTGSVVSFVGNTFTVNVNATGTYHFDIADSNSALCLTQTNDVEVVTPVKPTFTTTQVNVSCNGGTDGSVTVTPTAGVAPYTFTLTGPIANTSGDATGNYIGLIEGSYIIVVKDAYGCDSAPVPITIIEPTLLTANATAPVNTTCSVATEITVTATGGTTTGTGTGYYYSFDGGLTYDTANTYTVNDNGTVQTISYSVKDANGCPTVPQDIVVNPLNKPTDMDITGTLVFCNPLANQTSTVTINGTTNGVGVLTYTILSPVPAGVTQTGNVFAGLPAGDYTFQVTDANGCTYQKLYTVKAVEKIVVTGQLIADMTCNTGNDGVVEYTVSNFTGNYNYAVTKDGNPFTTGTNSTLASIPLTGLGYGVYEITVTDNTTLCTATATVTVAQPTVVTVALVDNINATCNTLAQVTVIASGGTPGYTYSFVQSGQPAGTFGNSNSALLDPTISTTWDVYAKDSNGCDSAPFNVTISTDILPQAITVNTFSQCPDVNGEYTFTISATTVAGAVEYSIGGAFQSSQTFTVSTPGTYNVTVKDKNECTNPVPFSVTILEPLTLSAAITIVPTCIVANGEVVLKATGGTIPASYEYSSDGLAYVPSNVFAGLAPSATPYTFYVRDTGTSCVKTVAVTIEMPNTAIDFNLTKTDVICNGESNGSITVNMDPATAVVNNNPVYTYSINPSLGTLVGNVFKNLPQGTYTVTVTSGKGCTVYKVITVGEPNPVIVTVPVVVQYGCISGNGTNYASIPVTTVTGGSTVYTVYEFLRDGNPIPVQKGANPIYTETDLLGGSYLINVYDNKGCVGTTTATINGFIAIDFTPTPITVTKAITCIDTENIQVNVGFTGGAPVALVYTIEGASTNVIPYPLQTNPTGIFANLTVGTYTITVTNFITGCSLKTIHYVNEPNTFNLVASNIQNVICFGTASGSADVTFVDNTTPPDDAGPFSYTITDPSGTTSAVATSTGVVINLSNLVAGLYTVKAQLVGTPTCEVTTSFTIAGPLSALTITPSVTPITCDPGNDGAISVVAGGGWLGNYEYELVGPVSVAYSDQFFFENLTPGSYTVNVRGINGCVATTATIVLKNPDPIVVTASATATLLACNGGSDGEIVVDLPTGGQGTNYSYILNNESALPVFSSAPQTSPIFSGLSAGSYSVTVVDGLGCISAPTAIITINEPAKVEASLVLATELTCLNDATLTLSAIGGTGAYEYSTDQNFTTILGAFTTPITFAVPVGDHQYYVRDANSCVSFVSNNVTIAPLTPLDLNLDLTNAVVYCNGSATAIIDANAVGGLGNYLYTLLDSANNVIRPAQGTGYFDALPTGNYIVRVNSGDCQYDKIVPSITEPANALTIDVQNKVDVSCNGANNGKIQLVVSGGTGQIGYAISSIPDQFFDSGIFENLAAGNYQVIVQDQNRCLILVNFAIAEPSPLSSTVTPGSILQDVCADDINEGAFMIDVVGGTEPYSVSLDDRNGTYTTGAVGQTTFDFTGLTGGDHYVFIRDANGCTTDVRAALDPSVIIDPKAVVNYICSGNAAGNTVTITIDGSVNPADVDYALDGSTTYQTSNVFTNLSPGPHTITARHSNGCLKTTASFTIIQVDPLTLVLNDGGLNEIVAVTTGGSGIYTYTLNGENYGSTSNFIIYKSGDYTVAVTDSYGCTVSFTQYFTYIDVCIPNNFTPNGDGINDTWGPGCTENYKNLVYSIFDRYGRIVGTYRVGQYWDGKYKGAELPSGDYWYVLKLNDVKDAREFVGHFTLYR